MSEDPRRRLAKEVAREHAAVQAAIQEIRDEIARLRSEPGPDHDAGRLDGLLVAFGHHLRRHFDLEEEGGFFRSSPTDPGTQRLVAHLVEQHRALGQRLSELITGAHRSEQGTASLTDAYAEALETFLDDLRDHERSENELIQALVLRDVGVGD